MDLHAIKQNESRLLIVRRGAKSFPKKKKKARGYLRTLDASNATWITLHIEYPKNIRRHHTSFNPHSALAPGTSASPVVGSWLSSYKEIFYFYGTHNFFSDVTKSYHLDHIVSSATNFSMTVSNKIMSS